VAALLVIACPLAAQTQQPEFKDLYWEVTPMFGYRTNISFKTDPVVNNVRSKITFEGGAAYGVAFGARFHDEDAVEFRWMRQDARVRFSPNFAEGGELSIDQFHLDFSHEYEIDGWPEGRPFIMLGIGASRISGAPSFNGFTRFSFGMGGGIKVFPSQQVGFKVQVQWLPIVFNPEVTALCAGNCVIQFGGKIGSQAEIAAGPVFRF
jgi:hypothetical protein